jgi:hypothetical protein
LIEGKVDSQMADCLMLGKGQTDMVYPPLLTEVVNLVPCRQINAVEDAKLPSRLAIIL